MKFTSVRIFALCLISAVLSGCVQTVSLNQSQNTIKGRPYALVETPQPPMTKLINRQTGGGLAGALVVGIINGVNDVRGTLNRMPTGNINPSTGVKNGIIAGFARRYGGSPANSLPAVSLKGSNSELVKRLTSSARQNGFDGVVLFVRQTGFTAMSFGANIVENGQKIQISYAAVVLIVDARSGRLIGSGNCHVPGVSEPVNNYISQGEELVDQHVSQLAPVCLQQLASKIFK